jgi:threonylcarbamoyladenosine tRNA methylthiotransferase MtaB
VGFPGESDAEFEETLAFIRRCAFSKMHIFPYSRRPGTRAAAMEGQLTRAVKTERARRAGAYADEMEEAYLASCVGQTLAVLFERESNGMCTGHGDNYCEVSAPCERMSGLVGNVEIHGVSGKMLVGDIV